MVAVRRIRTPREAENFRGVVVQALAIPDVYARDVAVAALTVYLEFVSMCEDPEALPSDLAAIVGTMSRLNARRAGIARQRAEQRMKRYLD
ncbi:hypothetical protein [Nonomuraea sp. 10N515B]|uniref:hypothetical protein n=1 Tax=Nonomuraea sp. 10N515B TaxID=3457422 RepID=UPI003FCEDB06